ncbi:MAG: erythromycin esterase family protein [Vicinamibacterales bacterium]
MLSTSRIPTFISTRYGNRAQEWSADDRGDEDRYPDRKVVVWSHTVHAMRNPSATRRGKDVGLSVGQALWEVLKDQRFAIGLTSFNGRSHWVTGADDYYQDLIPSQHPSVDFETLMNAAGHEIGFVNLRMARSRGDWLGGRLSQVRSTSSPKRRSGAAPWMRCSSFERKCHARERNEESRFAISVSAHAPAVR